MERKALELLKEWKTDEDRKPLILKGARQVGKTWLMKQFGRECYEDYFDFNFDEEEDIASILKSSKDPFRIVELLGMIKGKKIEAEKRGCYDVLPKYFVQGQNGEIDFLLEEGMQIIPVEVKAGEAVKANAFKRYIEKYKAECAIRYSALELKKQEYIINIPLYLIGKTRELISD